MKKEVFLFEILHHHEGVQSRIDMFNQDSNIKCSLFLGSFVMGRLDSIEGASISLYRQPLRKKWLEKKNSPVFFIYGILHWAESWIICFRFLFYVAQNKPHSVYINTPKSLLVLPVTILLPILKVRYTTVVHDTNIEKQGLLRFVLGNFYRKAETCFILGEYLDTSQLPKVKNWAVINNRSAHKINITTSFTKREKYFVLPGAYNQKLKNYDLVFKAFREASDIEDEIRLVLLTKVTKSLWTLIEKHNIADRVIVFNKFVPEETFKDFMEKSIACIVSSTGDNYGRYKISGAWTDAITFGSPIIVSSEYAKGYNFPPSVSRYKNSNELKDIVVSYKRDKNLYKKVFDGFVLYRKTYLERK